MQQNTNTITLSLNKKMLVIDQTWANYGPLATSGPPVFLFWPAGTYTNLNSHREFSGRPFFSLEIMDGSEFQKIRLNGAKLEEKTR